MILIARRAHQGVIVFTKCLRNETVVVGVYNRRIQHSVDVQHTWQAIFKSHTVLRLGKSTRGLSGGEVTFTCFFIQLILHFGPLWNLNHSIELIGRVAANR